jgi:hypothetical protein
MKTTAILVAVLFDMCSGNCCTNSQKSPQKRAFLLVVTSGAAKTG